MGKMRPRGGGSSGKFAAWLGPASLLVYTPNIPYEGLSLGDPLPCPHGPFACSLVGRLSGMAKAWAEQL